MNEDTSVVLVSNRGPVSFIETEDGFETRPGAGGLAGALDPVARRLGEHAVWIAAANSKTDRDALHAGEADGLSDLLGYPVYLLDIDPEIYAEYYDVVSNRMLWFANHCLWDELGIKEFGGRELTAWDRAYEPVNQRFAQAVSEVADPSGLVLFQDYHLATAPGHLRRLRPGQVIFHFTHSSFCSTEGLDRLPRPLPQKVIEGMLGADLLGFHVAQWVNGFLDCAERIGAEVDRADGSVKHDGRETWIREYPIPVDAAYLEERAASDTARGWSSKFRSRTDGPLIVRADRTEPSKNIVRGFEAFGVLLDKRPDLADKAHFVACIYPSRQSMPEYRDYARRIKHAAAKVNERHPGAIDLFLEDDYDRTLGALRVYDVLLVNPLMDGMNLVSKEGPVVNERDGVLVLSTGAGSFEELGDQSVRIDDPLDIDATARAIEAAIDMPDAERERRAKELSRRAGASKPEHWIEAQIADLEAISDGKPPVTPPC
jgi:trehalose 6-phosphate synthase